MLRPVIIIFKILLLFIPFNSLSQPIVIKSISETEVLRKKVQVRGEYIVAAMAIAKQESSSLELDDFKVFLKPTNDKLLCLRIFTMNGEYIAKPTYNINKIEPGEYILKFDSKFKKKLKDYNSFEIAITAWTSKKRCSKAKKIPTLFASWYTDRPISDFLILVNSGDTHAKILLEYPKDKKTMDCKKIVSKYTSFIYDKACYIDFTKTDKALEGWLRFYDFQNSYSVDQLHFSLLKKPLNP